MTVDYRPVTEEQFVERVNSVLRTEHKISKPSDYDWKTIKGSTPESKLDAELGLPIFVYLVLEEYGICPCCLGEGKFHYETPTDHEILTLPCQVCEQGQLPNSGTPDISANFKLVESIFNNKPVV